MPNHVAPLANLTFYFQVLVPTKKNHPIIFGVVWHHGAQKKSQPTTMYHIG